MNPSCNMKAFRQQPRTISSNRSIVNSIAIFITTVLFLRDISAAVPSRAGSVAIVHAYASARPPSYVSRSTNRDTQKCSCLAMNQSHRMACELRCGGITNHNNQGPSLPRRTTSLFVSKSSDGTHVKNSAQNNLIWSPKFWKKLLISTTIWFVIDYTSKKYAPNLEKMFLFSHDLPACHQGVEPVASSLNTFRKVLPTAAVLPLLSSSCCAIQLIINALSGWGCAGFNTYLGPIRPILLPIMLLSTWTLLPQRSLGWTFLSLFLAFLPESLDIWNTVRSRQWQQTSRDNNNKVGASSLLPVSAKLRLNCPTMGCVACVNKIDTSIRQCKSAANNIREEMSWLTETAKKGGTAELTISATTNEEIDRIAKEVVAAVEKAGFQCDVESLRVE